MKLRSQKSTSPPLSGSDADSDVFVSPERPIKKSPGSRPSEVSEEPPKRSRSHHMSTRNRPNLPSDVQHDTTQSKSQARGRRRQRIPIYIESDISDHPESEEDPHTVEEAREEHNEGATHASTRPRPDKLKQPRPRKPHVLPRSPVLDDPLSAEAPGRSLADLSNPAVLLPTGKSNLHGRSQADAQPDAMEVDQSPQSPKQTFHTLRDLRAGAPVGPSSDLSQIVQHPPRYDSLPVPKIFVRLPPSVTTPITSVLSSVVFEPHALLPRHYRIPGVPLTTLGRFMRGQIEIPLPQALVNRIPDHLSPGDKITYTTNLQRKYPEVAGATNQWIRFKLRDLDPPGACGISSWVQAEPDSGRRWRLYWAIYDAFALGIEHGKHQAESERIQRTIRLNP